MRKTIKHWQSKHTCWHTRTKYMSEQITEKKGWSTSISSKKPGNLLRCNQEQGCRLSCYAGDGEENEAEILAEKGGSDVVVARLGGSSWNASIFWICWEVPGCKNSSQQPCTFRPKKQNDDFLTVSKFSAVGDAATHPSAQKRDLYGRLGILPNVVQHQNQTISKAHASCKVDVSYPEKWLSSVRTRCRSFMLGVAHSWTVAQLNPESLWNHQSTIIYQFYLHDTPKSMMFEIPSRTLVHD